MNALELQAVDFVKASFSAVLLRRDFSQRLNASSSQITRLIRKLADEGMLLKISTGMYAKTRKSKLSGKVIPIRSLPELAREGLERLGITVLPSSAERAYNEGRSQQVPTGCVIGVSRVVNRRIGYDNTYVQFERVRAD
jgi:DNA-binding Lrp family transcriptional regulator